MARVLVLGGTGFLGGHIVDALRLTPDLEVIEGVREPAAGTGGPPAVAIDLVPGSIDDVAHHISELRPAVIVNCVGRTIGTWTELAAANVITVGCLLDAIRASAVPLHLIHLGSAAEYGAGPEGEPVNERAPANPVGAYGVAKLAATQLIVLAHQQGLVRGTVLRVFNAVGPRMPAHTLPGAAVRRLREAKMSLAETVDMGPLAAVRDFVDVRDVGLSVAAACSVGDSLSPIINIGSGQGHAARELVAELTRRVGYSGTLTERAAGSPRSTDVAWQVADISLARRTLRWQPSYDFGASCDAIVSNDQVGA
jgi:NDP-hexose 4-ketoreductase